MSSETETKSEEKLYAGKFKTVDDLENGYKNAAVVFEENKKLKEEREALLKTPDNYLVPQGVQVDPKRLERLQNQALKSGLTQAQFDKFLATDVEHITSRKQSFESKAKDLGEEKINLIKDYAKRTQPPELVDNLVNHLIRDDAAREAAFRHRETLLSNKLPGMENTNSGGYYKVSDDDVKKAYAAKEANPANMKARDHYINLLTQQAKQKSGV